jgi:2-oxoglutarate/2-oxoacid ferredoxin oxidoreductase subunit beta
MRSIVEAIHYQGLNKDEVAMVSGIGCTGRMSGYTDFNSIHTTHGRAPAFATGLKLARPDMHVFAVMGDGDAMSIGGNHLINAMRRNIDVTAIVVNNSIYGLTGGQSSPTTPKDSRTTTARYRTFERAMNLEVLARAGGAPFFARATVNHTASLTKIIERAMNISGFALVEIISNCHVLFGKMNERPDASRMIADMDEETHRSNPALKQRAARPVRQTAAGISSSQEVIEETTEGIHQESRKDRGVIIEHKGSVGFSRRYYAMLDNIRAQKKNTGIRRD